MNATFSKPQFFLIVIISCTAVDVLFRVINYAFFHGNEIVFYRMALWPNKWIRSCSEGVPSEQTPNSVEVFLFYANTPGQRTNIICRQKTLQSKIARTPPDLGMILFSFDHPSMIFRPPFVDPSLEDERWTKDGRRVGERSVGDSGKITVPLASLACP